MISDSLKVLFFLGKGGVGKTTISCNTANYLSNNKKYTYLLSIDPANNVFDFYHINSKSSIKALNEYLTVEELHLDEKKEEISEKTIDSIKSQYKYLTIFNLENIFNTLKYTPGITEYICLNAIYEIYIKIKDNFEYLIIDTPPTGLFIQIIALIKNTQNWIKELKKIRTKLLNKKEQLANIKRIKSEKNSTDKDKILNILKEEENVYTLLENIINDLKTNLILIINNDHISKKEGLYIINTLKELNVNISKVIINKANTKDIELDSLYKNYYLHFIPNIERYNSINLDDKYIKDIVEIE